VRSTKAFLIGIGIAYAVRRILRRGDAKATNVATDDVAVKQRIRNDALPAVGVSPRDISVEVEDGVATLRGSIEGTERADALIERVADTPGVRDVAAMIRVSDRRAA